MGPSALTEEWLSKLQEMGGQGWELVQVIRLPDGWQHAYFKRPVVEEKPHEG